MRLECHGLVRYLRSLLPVPHLDYSADELFGCNGTKTFERVWATEILTTHMRTPETRVDVAEDIDIICPSWLAEQFIGQLLPHALPGCVVDVVTDYLSPVKAYAWLEDMEVYSLIVVREIEAYMPDLPGAGWFNESLHQDILQTYFNFAKEFECLKLESSTKPQVQHAIEPGPFFLPVAHERGCKKGNSVPQPLLDDADFNLKNAKSIHHNSVKAFEVKPLDQASLLERYSGQCRHYRELEEYIKTIDIQNLVGRIGESKDEEPTELLDFDPADFLLDKLHIKENIMQDRLQSASLPSYVIGCLSLLDENSVTADINTVTKHAAISDTLKAMFELPEVLEDEYLDNSITLKIGAYIGTLMKPNPVKLEDLDSLEVAFQDFEKLLVLPELTLESSRFHFLRVPSFLPEHQARIPDDVYKVLFRAKTLPSSTSASDWLYLDWHLSQVGRCNNYRCFHLQRRMIENELRVTVQTDMIIPKRMPDLLLLLSLAEDFLPWHHAETECGNDTEEYPAAYLHAFVPTPALNFSNILYTAAKAADKTHADQPVLTDEVPLAGSGPTSMDSVLSLMKHARQGVLSRDVKLIQVPGKEFYQEDYQGIGNTKNQSHDPSPEDYQVLESALTAVKIPIPIPPYSSEIDPASSYNLLSSNHVEPELLVPLHTPACPSKELPQMGFKSAPHQQPAYDELNPQQSEVDDLIQISIGQGPHLIIVANILQPNGSIVLQRRSSYQKILGLENEDLQVVERELKLPVDLILNPSTCLTIYTEEKLLWCTKIRNPNSEEFFSSVMDTIVDCHMRALSFSFQRWFVIFEGELALNSTIIRILNKLYICSAGFQMRVQGFISSNPIATDSLVLRCIKMIWKMSKRPFDFPMSEDLTDGEVCLATFPSLNPLSSHAILCLNVPIATFISWSNEEQYSALQDFNVRAESLNLLKAQVLYGKLETSSQQGIFSECSWPAVSEIVAPEVGRHVQAAFTYFPPASEITSCELEENSDVVSPRAGHSDLYPPSCPDPSLPYHSAEQGTFAWNGEFWPYDDNEPATLPYHANIRTQQPNRLQEYYDCRNPVNVHGILQRRIRGRKGDDKDLNHSETESELFCDSYRARPCVNRLPTSDECLANAVYPSYRYEATDAPRWAPLQKTSVKRSISALDQFRHQGGVSPASRSPNKKLKLAVPSNRSRENGPSSQLDHSLKISRQSCYKFNSPFGRSI